MTVEYTDVESSNVQVVGHDGTDLYVRFINGTEYKYEGVSEEEFIKLRDAASVGKHLNAYIKPRYNYEQVG